MFFNLNEIKLEMNNRMTFGKFIKNVKIKSHTDNNQ